MSIPMIIYVPNTVTSTSYGSSSRWSSECSLTISLMAPPKQPQREESRDTCPASPKKPGYDSVPRLPRRSLLDRLPRLPRRSLNDAVAIKTATTASRVTAVDTSANAKNIQSTKTTTLMATPKRNSRRVRALPKPAVSRQSTHSAPTPMTTTSPNRNSIPRDSRLLASLIVERVYQETSRPGSRRRSVAAVAA